MKEPSFTVHRPAPEVALPLVIHVPHAADAIPAVHRAGLALDDDALREAMAILVDHDTDRLALSALPLGAHVFVNEVCRLVLDPERYADDAAESAAAAGFGVVYTRAPDGRPLRRPGWTAADRAALLDALYHPYHAAMRGLVVELHERFGGPVFILDLHSFPACPVRWEAPSPRPRPSYCLGFEEGRAPAGWLEWWALREAEGPPAADRPLVDHNHPFAGAFVPGGLPAVVASQVSALMLEVHRSLLPAWPQRPPLPAGHEPAALAVEFIRFVCGDLRRRARGMGVGGI